jgi:hypothetical protein
MGRRRAVTSLVVSSTCVALVGAAFAATAAAVAPPGGVGKPPPSSGIGTAAALEHPQCRTGAEYGRYGRFDAALQGQGPICVKPWSADDDNGGATAPGVTADSITVVAVVPSDAQATATGATDRATRSKGSYKNAFHDYALPLMRYYETWGRDIDVRLVESGGVDEAAQRADAVKIKEMKPFAVMDVVPAGLDVLDAELAKSKILVFGYATSFEEAIAQAPYRWGHSDTQANASNAAEVVGKHLANKKAEYGGDDLSGQTRKFGAVYVEDIIDVDALKSSLRKNGATLRIDLPYQATGSTLGDPTSAQEQAPVIVQRMKDAGVTTVVLFTDVAMTRSLQEHANRQEWFPEWFFTGTLFADLALLARQYPAEQMEHAFGNSTVSPWTLTNSNPQGDDIYLTDLDGPLNWYWGQGVGTSSQAAPQGMLWLMRGIHAAGPKLTAKTFQQGLFATPPRGGAAEGQSFGSMTAYGPGAGLPYDAYLTTGADFTAFWWDPALQGPGAGTGTDGKGNAWFVDGAKRYRAGQVPKKPFRYFTEQGAVSHFETRPEPRPPYAGDCEGCPSQGGPGTPGTPSPDGFVAKYVGVSRTTAPK